MRTKRLILTAALGLASIATTMAQVYSVNAVGYVNKSLPPGFSIIANPLDAGTGNNTVSKLLAAAPDGTVVYAFNNATGQYTINSFAFGAWDVPDMNLDPGKGVFIRNPGTNAVTITFVGEVPQGHLVLSIPKGFSIIASKVPQSAGIDTMSFPAAEGDFVYRYNATTGQYSISSFAFGSWDVVPTPDVGEGFFINKAAAVDWVRDFSVNQ